MKQVIQHLSDGQVRIVDVPPPAVRPYGVIVQVHASLISPGTERRKVLTGARSLLGMARSRPDQVRQVVDKARSSGARETFKMVRARLDQPQELGYSAAGVVQAAGRLVTDLRPGDRVACAGAGYANHAELIYVPGNLCAALPETVGFEAGAFGTMGAIALHGVRQANARVGERVAVIGLGLVGQLSGQILRAAGCEVVGIDLDEQVVDFAQRHGALDSGVPRSRLNGPAIPTEAEDCDAVVIAAATDSDDPVRLAPALCRDRARVVVIGDVGMDMPRPAYYEKELDLCVSRSYGPGRYDPEYEERGLDYPIGYVRWTERRNIAAFLALMANNRIDVSPLIGERLPLDQAPKAYERLASAQRSPLGIVLQYLPTTAAIDDTQQSPFRPRPASPCPAVGMIGAGHFAQRVLIPALRQCGLPLQCIASASGLTAASARTQFGFSRATTADHVIADPTVELVVVATRHATHAEFAETALRAGKAVFVEKPPCLTYDELLRLRHARQSDSQLAVGFNRRYAPLAVAMRKHIENRARPVHLLYRVNAEELAGTHWLNDLEDGGGRLRGEGCHFVDFACWMVGSLPRRVTCVLAPDPASPLASAQEFQILLAFPDGSAATLVYCPGGANGLAKEYVEAHTGGRSVILHDFRSATLWDGRHKQRIRTRRQDKGHQEQIRALYGGGDTQRPPSHTLDPLDSMAITLAALDAGENGVTLGLSRDGRTSSVGLHAGS